MLPRSAAMSGPDSVLVEELDEVVLLVGAEGGWW